MTWSPLYTEDRFRKRREQRDKLQVQIEEMQQTMERLDKKIARYEQGHGADGKRTQTVKKEAGAAARLPLLRPKIFTKRKLFFDRRVWYTYAEKTESEKHCMEFAQLVTRRRSVRAYHARAVEADKLEAILRAGTYAPSGGNNQSCHFLVITDRALIMELVNIATDIFAQMQVLEGMYRSLANTIRRAQKERFDFTYGAPVLLIVANQVGYGNAMADSAMALENMFLQAADLGVSSCYINQFHWLAEDAAIVRALRAIGLGETETVCAGGVFGYSNQKLPPLKRFGNIITYVGQEKEKL